MAGVRKMNVSCDGNIVTVDGVKDFRLSQILECGQCFHFDKLDDEVYEVIAFGRAVKMEQSGGVLRIFYDTDKRTFEDIWVDYFDLERDYGAIKRAILRKDDKLKAPMDMMWGIRILNQSFFETMISFIISQNKNIPQIKQCVKNISHRFGDEVIGYNGEAFYVFPDVDRLHEVTEDELRECKVGFRAPYIMNATEAVYSGNVTKEKLDALDIEQARELLMTIKGVGEKVANCVLLFGLGRREAFPVDVWMKRIMESMYFDGKDTKKLEIEAFAVKKFGNLGGYAQQYLFDYARTTLFK